MNNINFTGNLGSDAQVRQAGQTNVCSFAVAMKSGYGDRKQTIWIDCSLWGKRADGGLPALLLKGQMVAVNGEIGTREHEGKTYITCNVQDVTLCGGDRQQQPQQQPQQQNQQHNQGYGAPQQQPVPSNGYTQPQPQNQGVNLSNDDIPF